MSGRLFSTILEQHKKLKTTAERVAWLRANASKPLFYILWVAFSDKVKWLLPDGAPPFKAWETARLNANGSGRLNRPGSEPSDLLRELRRLYVFLDGSGNTLTQLRREKLFQEVLEGLSKAEVDVLLAAKDKRFDKEYKLSRKVLDEAFPGLLDAPFTLRFISR